MNTNRNPNILIDEGTVHPIAMNYEGHPLIASAGAYSGEVLIDGRVRTCSPLGDHRDLRESDSIFTVTGRTKVKLCVSVDGTLYERAKRHLAMPFSNLVEMLLDQHLTTNLGYGGSQ